MSDLYDRLRAVACVAWGVPPWELQAAIASEAVDIADVVQAGIVLTMLNPFGALPQYLYDERPASPADTEADKRAKAHRSQLGALVARAKPKTPEEAARQMEILQALSAS